MKCTECREKLVEYTENLLSEQQQAQMEAHLESCVPCREQYDLFIAIGRRIASDADTLQSVDLEQVVLNRIMCEQNKKQKQAEQSAYRLKPWSILMNIPLKLTAAAAILIAAALALTVFDKTVTPAQAVQQMRNAMNTVTWMHCYADTKRITDTNSENWLSPSLGIDARRNDDNSVIFTYYKTKETSIYDPNTNTITLAAAGDNNPWYKASSPTQCLDLIIESLNDNDHPTTTTTQDGENIIYEITIPRGDPPGSVGTEIWRLIANKKTHLLMRMELEGWDEIDTFIKVANVVCDYPETGPMDIYALGVPENAKIIDKRPTPEVRQILDNYQTARLKDVASFTAVELISRDNKTFPEANIWHVDREVLRKENVWIQSDFILDETNGIFGSLYTWCTDPTKTSPRKIELYDGKYYYRLPYDYGASKFNEPRKSTYFKRTPMSRFFFENWAEIAHFMTFNQSEPAVTQIVNEYSQKHNVICLQKLYDESGGTPHGRFFKRLCYLDPAKDYLCCRFESYLIQDQLWLDSYNNAENTYVSNPDQSLEYTQHQIKEVTQFGQTTSGQWYPTEIQKKTTTQFKNKGTIDDTNIIKIYLDTERPIPPETFAPESFKTYLSE